MVDEVLHWITQPEVWENPEAWILASQSRDILEGMSLEEDMHLAVQVRNNLQQMWGIFPELRTGWILLNDEWLPDPPWDLPENAQSPPKAANRRKKKRRGKRPKDVLMICLGAVFLSSSSPMKCLVDRLPILDPGVFLLAADRMDPSLTSQFFTLQELYWRMLEDPAMQNSLEAAQLTDQLQGDFATITPTSPRGDLERLRDGMKRLLQLRREPVANGTATSTQEPLAALLPVACPSTGTYLALKGAMPIGNAIPRIPKIIKGTMPAAEILSCPSRLTRQHHLSCPSRLTHRHHLSCPSCLSSACRHAQGRSASSACHYTQGSCTSSSCRHAQGSCAFSTCLHSRDSCATCSVRGS